MRTPALTRSARALVLINERRVKEHLVPLERDLVLASLAREHVRNMRRKGFFDHADPQGQTFEERVAHLKRSLTGEVLVYGSGGFGTAKGIVDLWFSSPGHKRVLLTPEMRRIGVSVIGGWFLGHAGISVAVANLSS